MMKVVKRLISYPPMQLQVPELSLSLKECLIAELVPYQTITVNPSSILFQSHQIKAEKSSNTLLTLTNLSKSSAASIGFLYKNTPVSLLSSQIWRISQPALILATSKAVLSLQQDFFHVSGEGSVLISGVQMLNLSDETLYIPHNKLAAAEEQLNLTLGTIQGHVYWKIVGAGNLYIGAGNYPEGNSKGLEEFVVEAESSDPEPTSILQNNDILVSSI